MFRSPASTPVQPIYYPDLFEKEQTNEPDNDRARSQQTMYPGLLLGLLEYYCKTPRVVLRAYLVRQILCFLSQRMFEQLCAVASGI
jgi:hypothetical protein